MARIRLGMAPEIALHLKGRRGSSTTTFAHIAVDKVMGRISQALYQPLTRDTILTPGYYVLRRREIKAQRDAPGYTAITYFIAKWDGAKFSQMSPNKPAATSPHSFDPFDPKWKHSIVVLPAHIRRYLDSYPNEST